MANEALVAQLDIEAVPAVCEAVTAVNAWEAVAFALKVVARAATEAESA